MTGNYGLRSRYFKCHEFELLTYNLEVGDLLEFDRGIYCHWAVYFGMYEFEDEVIPCVVHRNNDDPSSAVFSSLSSMRSSVSSVNHSVGKTCLQPLKEVIRDSPVRINNYLDNDQPPRKEKEILYLLMEEVLALSKCGRSKTLYNLWSNNCEHFAKWVRNGNPESKQVENVATGLAVGTVLGIGAMAIGIFLGSKDNKSKQRYY